MFETVTCILSRSNKVFQNFAKPQNCMALEANSLSSFEIKNIGIKFKTLTLANREKFYILHIQHRKGYLTYLGICCVCSSKMTKS